MKMFNAIARQFRSGNTATPTSAIRPITGDARVTARPLSRPTRVAGCIALAMVLGSATSWATVVTVGGGATIVCPATPTATYTTPPTGVTFSNWSRGSGVTCGSAADGISGSVFNAVTAAAGFTANRFYQITITADATHTFTLSSITWLGTVSSGTATFTVQTSNNGGANATFGTAAAGVTGSAISSTFSGSVTVAAGTSVVVYLIPSNTAASTTTVRFKNGSTFTVTASVVGTAAPSVTTQAADTFTTTGATLHGTVTADGGAALTDRGFYYQTTPTVTTSGTQFSEGGTTVAAFSKALGSLAVNTIYYYRTYAINSQGTGLGASDQSFYTLANTPSAPTVNNANTTTLDVAITAGDGNPAATAYAIQETTSGNYVQASGALSATAVYQTAAIWGTKTVTGLTPSTSYTFKVKAQNGALTDTAFSSTTTLSTISGATPPTVTTEAADTFTTSGATLHGTVTADGGASLTDRGFYYQTTPTVTVGTGTQFSEGGTSVAAFSKALGSLAVNTIYYYRAYAINSAGTGLGASDVLFYTLANTPSAPTVNGATPNSLNVAITAGDGNPAATTYAIQETTSGNYVQANGTLSATAVYATAATWSTKTVTGLSGSTTYTFQVKAQNGALVDTAFSTTTNGTTQATPLAAWDLTGNNAANATVAATVFSANLDSATTLTAGSTATPSAGGNSYRTLGFKNEGVSTANTDYFQITLSAASGYSVSLSTIDAQYAGTAGYSVSPGVTMQYAYSLDGSTFTLIGSSFVKINNGAMSQIDLTGVSALQNVPAATTVTIRFYASGQTTTGSWGYTSPSAGAYGLAIGGTATVCTTPTAHNVTGTGSYCTGGSGLAVGLDGSESGVTYQLFVAGSTPVGSPVTGTGAAFNFPGTQTAGTYTVVATRTVGGCTANMSGNAVVTANAASVGGTASAAPNSTCSGNGSSISLTGNTGSIVKWQYSSDNFVSDTHDIVSTANPYSTGPLTSTTYFRAVVQNGVCASANSSSAQVTITGSVTPTVTVAAVPSGAICAGTSVTFTATPNTGGTNTYTWKKNNITVGGSGNTYTDGGLANGDTIDSHLVTTDPCASPSTADATQITMSVSTGASISVQPSNASACSGLTASFMVTASNATGYQWQVSTNGGATFANVTDGTGGTSSTYTTVATTAGMNNYKYHLVVSGTSPCAAVTSDPATLTVNTFNPGATQTTLAYQGFETSGDTWTFTSTGLGGSASVNVAGSAFPAANQQVFVGSQSWQVNNSGAAGQNNTFATINTSGFTSTQVKLRLSATATSSGNGEDNTDVVQVYVALNGAAFSATPDITINGAVANNSQWGTTATGNATTTAGTPVTVVAATAGNNPAGPSTLIVNIPDGTTTVALKVRAQNNSSTEYWNIDDIKLLGTETTASIRPNPADATMCTGGSGVVLTAGPNGMGYSWSSSPAGFSSASQNPTVTPSSTTTYTVTVTDGNGCTSQASQTVTVNPTTVAGTVASDQTICTNTNPVDLTLTGQTGSVTKWQKSSDVGFTSPIDIAVTSTTLLGTTIGPLTADTWFRAVVQSGVCSSADSASVKITVTTTSAPSAAANQAFCSGANPTVADLSATGTFIQWYDAATNGNLLSPGAALVTGNYYASDTANGCESTTRTAVAVTVNTTPSAPSASSPQTFCSATNPTVASLSATGTLIQWYDAATNGNLLSPGTALVTGNYYASDTVNSCESTSRTLVAVTVNPTPAAPSTAGGSRCGPGTVDLSASGSGGTLNWYSDVGLTNLVHTGTNYTTPSLSSTTTYYVTETSGAGCPSTASTVTATITTCNYIQAWRFANFGIYTNTGNAANTANPDGDTLLNLAEFGFGTNPNTTTASSVSYTGANSVTPGLPTTEFTTTAPFAYALFSRPSNYAAAGLSYQVQFTADGTNYVTSTATPTVMATDTTTSIQAVRVPYPLSINGKKPKAFRIIVSITPDPDGL